MNKILFLFSVIVMLSVNACSTTSVLKQKNYNPELMDSVAIVEPLVVVEKIRGQKVEKQEQVIKSSTDYIRKSFGQKLSPFYQLEFTDQRGKKTEEWIYKMFARIDFVLERGGLYDRESNVRKSHLDTELNNIQLDKGFLEYIQKYESDYVLISMQDGIIQDIDMYGKRETTTAEVVGGLQNAMLVDNSFIPAYSYLAIALLEKKTGEIIYFDKNYRHQDPREEKVIENQIKILMDGIKRKKKSTKKPDSY